MAGERMGLRGGIGVGRAEGRREFGGDGEGQRGGTGGLRERSEEWDWTAGEGDGEKLEKDGEDRRMKLW